jgi:BASS family bile acid:Na+ symporter
MSRLLALLINAFPLWVLALCALAMVEPVWFTWFSGGWIVWTLAAIMLGMGLTLTLDDFRRIVRIPRPVALGFAAQFTLMPLLAWGIATALKLETPFAVGLILVGCCPGGTASNLVTFLARGDVALSVVMTMCSTLAAVVMTPLLTQWVAGALVVVDGWGLLTSTAQVVLLPVALGVLLNQFVPRIVAKITPAAPLVSVLGVALICASIVGQSSTAIRTSGGSLLLAIVLLHAGGFSLGYLVARLFGFSRTIARTVSIEVGMQNSGLGVVLARRHFADPLTAVPGAISAVCHSVLGSLAAGYWRLRPELPPQPAVTTRTHETVTPSA